MAYKIVLDAGHGGEDPGAVYKDRKEKDDNLKLTLAVGKILEENGVDVVYTRTTDIYQTPFEKAKAANVEKVFLKTTYEGDVSDFPIYSQPKVNTFVEDDCVTCSNEELDSTRAKVREKNFNIFSPTWLFHAFNYYGDDYIFRLLSFIKEEDISDLHGGNLGWVGDRPVIVDYAGFES